ncbi:hypothetical protein E2542_SST28283 [Spatholobus suberectus]|nr:hypothetical protein E2542_SST28283 [Spatholobus suberectus]
MSNSKEKPQYEKYIYKGLPFGDELTSLFKDVVAIGKYGWAPSLRTLLTNIDANNYVYHPSLEEVDCIDLEEGLGNYEEIILSNEPSAGVSRKLGNINLSFSHGNSSGMSHN